MGRVTISHWSRCREVEGGLHLRCIHFLINLHQFLLVLGQIKTEYGEEPRIVIVDEDEEKEEEDQIDKALRLGELGNPTFITGDFRELRLLQKRRERIEMIAQEQQRRLQV